MIKEKRFSTILGLIFLLVCIAIGLYLTGSVKIFNSKASGDCHPDNPQVTNITNTSADISFITSAACSVTVSINGQIFDDIKLTSPSRIHYFQIKNLKNTTTYNFSLISNNETYSDNNFTFKTGSIPKSSLPTSNLAWGRVLNSDAQTAANAIVYLNIPGASPLSSLVTTDGNWSISLANSFNEAKEDWFLPSNTATDEDIVVISDDGVTTQVTNNTAVNNPVPDIIIGQDSFSSPKINTNPVGNFGNQSPVAIQEKLDILNPQTNETLNVARPDFFGTAPINSKVIIEIHSSQTTNGESSTNADGLWHWSPDSDLTPGEHTITVKVQDTATGLWTTISRSFTVLASNGGPAYEASSSATTSPTSIPTSTPTKIITPFPTATITTTVTPLFTPASTSTPRLTLTLTLSPTNIVPTATIPVTGNSFPTISLLTLAIFVFLLAGIFL